MKTRLFKLLLLLLFLSACNTEITRENDKSDIGNACKIVDEYYQNLKNNDYSKALTSFDEYVLTNDSIGMYNHLEETIKNKGLINNFEFLEGKSKVIISNGIKNGNYTLLYRVNYQNESRNERFELKTNSNQNIKIIECVFEIK